VLVPYSTYHVVAVPFGLTPPERVAAVGATDVTGPVEAVGAVAAAAAPAPASAVTVRRRAMRPVSSDCMSACSYPAASPITRSQPEADRRPPPFHLQEGVDRGA
jgi:hypothetical protein